MTLAALLEIVPTEIAEKIKTNTRNSLRNFLEGMGVYSETILNNIWNETLQTYSIDVYHVLAKHFNFKNSPEGFDFWMAVVIKYIDEQ